MVDFLPPLLHRIDHRHMLVSAMDLIIRQCVVFLYLRQNPRVGFSALHVPALIAETCGGSAP